MAAHGSLREALTAMTWSRLPAHYALVGIAAPPTAEDIALLDPPSQMIIEQGETTLLLPEARLPELLGRHADARVEKGLVWVRFEAPMGWEVVGFLAHVTGALAAAGVPLGAVCSYARDHLFIAEKHMPRAEEVLGSLFPGAGAGAGSESGGRAKKRGPAIDPHAPPGAPKISYNDDLEGEEAVAMSPMNQLSAGAPGAHSLKSPTLQQVPDGWVRPAFGLGLALEEQTPDASP